MPDRQENTNKIYDETKVLYDGSDFMVIEPLTQKSVSYFTNDNNDYVKHWVSKYRDVGNLYLIIDKRYTPTNFYGIYNDDGDIEIYYFDGEDFGRISTGDFFDSVSSEVKESLKPFIFDGTTYGILTDIKNGKDFSLNDLKDSSSIIDKIRYNEKRPGKSMVSLHFNGAEDYFSAMGAPEDSLWLIRELFDTYYMQLEITNHDNVWEDWNEGYLLSTFDTDNNELLKEILTYVGPHLLDKESGGERDSEISKLLIDMFEREIDWIITDYADEDNSCRVRALRKSIEDDACDVMGEYGIFMGDCFSKYFTTVDILIQLYNKNNDKTQSLESLLGELIDGDNMDYHDWMYETWCDENFDEELNKQIKHALTSIIEKIEESDEFVDIREYSELYTKYVDKYGLNKSHKSPVSDNTFFIFKGVNKKNNKLVVGVSKDTPYNFQSREYDEEGFNLFLNQPELF